jgi:hypothetical protein
MLLTVGSRAPVMLSSNAAPVSFAGDTPTSARLTSGGIVDLNVMTRRERFSHHLHRIQGPIPCSFEDGDDVAVVVSHNGRTTITCDRDTATLDHNDAVVIDRKDNINFRILPETGQCYLILLREQRAR